MKVLIQEEDITFVNIYAPKTGASNYVKQILTDRKGEVDSSTILVGDLNIPIYINGQITQTENKETLT